MTAVDAVVIGGGILGASTAFSLAREGLRVVVLERGAVNREGSGTTAGNLHIQAIHTRRPGQVVPVDNVRFLPLQRAASDLWTTVEDELEADVELRRPGGFMVAETEHQLAELHEKRVHERACGIPGEVLDGDAARTALPLLSERVIGASWCPWDGYVNPLKVTGAWLAAARRLGVEVRAFTPVTGLALAEGTWTVRTPAGSWTAPHVVCVCGPWIPQVTALAGAEVALQSVAIQMHVTERVRPVMEHVVQHIGEGMSVKQVTSGQVMIGGGWPAEELSLTGRQRPSVTSLLGNLRQAARILPFLADLRLLRTWAGPLAATPDEMPVIGEVPEHPGLMVAGGTYAFTFAPLWARVLTDLVVGRPPLVEVADLGVERLYGVTARQPRTTTVPS